MSTKSKENYVNLDDFGTGILAGLAAEGVHSIVVTNLDKALVSAYEFLEAEGHPLRFHLVLDRYHGDSPSARRAIGGAVSRGMGFFDDDRTLYLKVSQDYSHLYLEHLPLTPSVWRSAARIVLAQVRQGTP